MKEFVSPCQSVVVAYHTAAAGLRSHLVYLSDAVGLTVFVFTFYCCEIELNKLDFTHILMFLVTITSSHVLILL